MKKLSIACLASIGLAVAACSSDSTTAPANQVAVGAASAFAVAPTGFDQLSTSFDASATDDAFMPSFERDMHGDDHGHHGFGPLGVGPGFGLGFMGGGLRAPFLGEGIGFFLDHVHDNCTFDATTGIHTCTATKRDGLTITRTLEFTTAGGTAQQAFDPATTDVIKTTTDVTGTEKRHDGASTSTVDESSSATLSGLTSSTNSRTLNALSAGTETTTGTSPDFGPFTAKRTAGDTITNVVFPGKGTSTGPAFPSSGTIVRSVSVSITLGSQSTATATRREVVTFDGTNTAKVVITQDGTTQNCTLPLPFGHLSCQ